MGAHTICGLALAAALAMTGCANAKPPRTPPPPIPATEREARLVLLDPAPCSRGGTRVAPATAEAALAAPLVALAADFAVGFVGDWLKRRQTALNGTFLATGAAAPGEPLFGCLIVYRGVLTDAAAPADPVRAAAANGPAGFELATLRDGASFYMEAELTSFPPRSTPAPAARGTSEAAPAPPPPVVGPTPPATPPPAAAPVTAPMIPKPPPAPPRLLAPVYLRYADTSAGRRGSGWKNVTVVVAFAKQTPPADSTAPAPDAPIVYRFDLGRIEIGRIYAEPLLRGAGSVQLFPDVDGLNAAALVTESERSGPALDALVKAFDANAKGLSKGLQNLVLGDGK